MEFNIRTIAARCGFSSVYALIRAFTREVGMAPTRYRAHLWKRRNSGKPGRKRTSPDPDAPQLTLSIHTLLLPIYLSLL